MRVLLSDFVVKSSGKQVVKLGSNFPAVYYGASPHLNTTNNSGPIPARSPGVNTEEQSRVNLIIGRLTAKFPT